VMRWSHRLIGNTPLPSHEDPKKGTRTTFHPIVNNPGYCQYEYIKKDLKIISCVPSYGKAAVFTMHRSHYKNRGEVEDEWGREWRGAWIGKSLKIG
jgi:hypothetical protein